MTKAHPSLWEFSTCVYTMESIPAVCIHLQDQYQWNIPLLLFCSWFGKYSGTLSQSQGEKIRSFTEGYTSIATQPLRELRRNMKTAYDPQWYASPVDWEQLREQVKAAELQSEKLLLDSLERQCGFNPVGKGSLNGVLTNVKHCFDVPADPSLLSQLAIVLHAVFVAMDLRELQLELEHTFL